MVDYIRTATVTSATGGRLAQTCGYDPSLQRQDRRARPLRVCSRMRTAARGYAVRGTALARPAQ